MIEVTNHRPESIQNFTGGSDIEYASSFQKRHYLARRRRVVPLQKPGKLVVRCRVRYPERTHKTVYLGSHKRNSSRKPTTAEKVYNRNVMPEGDGNQSRGKLSSRGCRKTQTFYLNSDFVRERS